MYDEAWCGAFRPDVRLPCVCNAVTGAVVLIEMPKELYDIVIRSLPDAEDDDGWVSAEFLSKAYADALNAHNQATVERVLRVMRALPAPVKDDE